MAEETVAAINAAPPPVLASTRDESATTAEEKSAAVPMPLWREYLMLTKPRVISLLLATTWLSMIIARGSFPGWPLFLWTGLGFYLAAGSAHVFNMILDRDIDAEMPRTATRALVTGRISVANALIYGVLLEVFSFAILWHFATPLSAWMALAGHLFYVVIYTAFLKRRTWNNIVIGGAAGSFPPLVGWAAVTGDLPALAWLLFAIIFVWTPVHFWALAILIKDDYAKASIPMLPVLVGEKKTAIQIGFYTAITVIVTFVPLMMREAGWIYLLCAAALNWVLVARSLKLWREPSKPRASSLFHYSMLYLALLFLALAIDRSALPRAAASTRSVPANVS